MLKSSVIEVLRKLDKTEIKRFDEFLSSPYFNKKSSVTKLFRIVKKSGPDFNDESLDREMLWKVLFPRKDFNYGVMKNLIFDLQKLMNNFLATEGLRKKDYLGRISLIEELSEKNLDRQFEKSVKIYTDILENEKVNENYFFEFTKLEGLKYNHHIIKNAHQIVESQFLENFEQYLLLDFLRQYFILNINLASYKKDFKKAGSELEDIGNNIEKLFHSFMKASSQSEATGFHKDIILMHYYGYKITLTSDPQYYFGLKELMDKYSGRLDMVEQYNIYNLLTGFCVYRSLEGDNNFYKEEFELYKTILKKEAFCYFKDGFMNRLTYYNIARVGIKLKEFDWTIKFLDKYKSRLPETFREQTFLFTYAFMEFGRKDFIKALELLSGLSHYEVRDKPREKMLYLMLYYELGYVEQLISFVDSCRHFAKNDKLLSEHYKGKFLSFVNCISSLAKIKFNEKTSEFDESIFTLKQTINDKEVSLRDWLIDKIGELKLNKENNF